MPLATRLQLVAHFGNRLVEADRSEQILQSAPFPHVHLNTATRHQRQVQLCAELRQRGESTPVVTSAQQLYGEPGALRAERLQPFALRRFRIAARKPQRETVTEIVRCDLLTRQSITALVRTAACTRDEAAQPTIGGAIGGKKNESQPVDEREFAAHDELEPGIFCRFVCTHHASDRADIGERQRAVIEFRGTFDELVGMRGTFEKGEIAAAMKLGVRHGASLLGQLCTGFMGATVPPQASG